MLLCVQYGNINYISLYFPLFNLLLIYNFDADIFSQINIPLKVVTLE